MKGTQGSHRYSYKIAGQARPASHYEWPLGKPPVAKPPSARRASGGPSKNALAHALIACTLFFQGGCLAAPSGSAVPVASSNNNASKAVTNKADATQAPGRQEQNKPVLDPNKYFGKAKAGYAAAKECPEICAKLFCYCGCDLTDEHVSLLDCFTTDHGVDCYICQEEALAALKMKQQGKGLAEIQKVIDLAYKKEYPFDDKSPAYKKYQAAKLWKDTGSTALDKAGYQGGASSAKGKSGATSSDAKGPKPGSAGRNAKSATKGSCCAGKSKTK
jgi:hypothetical protein